MEETRFQRTRRALAQEVRNTDDDFFGDGDFDDTPPGRLPTSSRRYPVADVRAESGRRTADSYNGYNGVTQRYTTQERSSIPSRRTAAYPVVPAGQSKRMRTPRTEEEFTRHNRSSEDFVVRRRIRVHWAVFVGVAMFVMILGWFMISALGSWWQVTQDDWQYGRPRTYQTNAVVGHSDSPTNPSHFIAMNLNRHIVVIEMPGGDPSKARIFNGPTLIGPGQDLVPVTLTFKDVNGDGKIDMIVNVQDSHFVFLNKNGTFVPAPGQS
jgi:hypothetical protein